MCIYFSQGRLCIIYFINNISIFKKLTNDIDKKKNKYTYTMVCGVESRTYIESYSNNI